MRFRVRVEGLGILVFPLCLGLLQTTSWGSVGGGRGEPMSSWTHAHF